MRRVISLFLLLLLLAACAAPAEDASETPETPEVPAEADSDGEPDETEDHVLLTLEAPIANGRTLTLEAVGRVLDEYSCGVREVRVYDGEELVQTVMAREGIQSEGVEPFSDYTECWKPEESMEVLDLNFDGNTDFGLFGGVCNNTIPYYYWTWDPEARQYRFSCILQGGETHPETQEVTAEYKSGSAGSQWITEHYQPDENGVLYLTYWERLVRNFEPDSGYLDVDREGALETWVPKEGTVLRPRPEEWGEADLVLIRREVPLYEINADNTASHYTELWELKDGQFQMTSREEFSYESQP